MKPRFLLTAICMFVSLAAFAQFNDSEFNGVLERYRAGMKMDGTVLNADEQALILANVDGVDRTAEWAKYKKNRAIGKGLIIGGSSAAAAGAVVFVGTGVVWVLVAALGGGIAAAAGGDGQEAVDNISKQFEPWFIGSGAVTIAGAGAAIAGIPMVVVNNRKMNGIVNDWNNANGHGTEDVSLNFGAAPSGIGFTLNF